MQVLFLGACTVGNEPLVIVNEFMAGGSLEDRFNSMSPVRFCACACVRVCIYGGSTTTQ